MSLPSLVILDASIFYISCGKTDRQTDRHIHAAELPIHVTAVGMGKDIGEARIFN